MSKLILPALINPPTIRKDGSIRISFDSRELSAEEYMIVMGFRNSEGWLCYSPNEEDLSVPKEQAEVEEKSPSQRQKSVLYILYNQAVKKGKYIGTFQTYYRESMEKLIQQLKDKIDD